MRILKRSIIELGRHAKREKGAALVELALTMPALTLLLLGASEFARGAYAGIEASNAARAGAAFGSYSSANASNTSGIQAAAAADAPDLSGLTTTSSVSGICSSGTACTGTGGACVSTDCTTAGDHIETVVTVNTQVIFNPLIHLPGSPSTLTLHGKAVQKVLPQ